MKVSQLIPETNICIGWPGEETPRTRNKWKLLTAMMSLVAEKGNFSADISSNILESVLNREKSMSTGIGHGIAIPHAAVESISKPTGCMVVLNEGLDFESLDQENVYVVFLVLIPVKNYQKHIQILSNILFIIGKTGWLEELLNAPDASRVRDVLVQLEE